MSRKNAGKNSPDSISQIAALILMALGTLFSVLGLLGYVLDLPMKAGEARGFSPYGTGHSGCWRGVRPVGTE